MKSTNDDDYYASDDVMAERKSGRNVVNKLVKMWLGTVMGGGGGGNGGSSSRWCPYSAEIS